MSYLEWGEPFHIHHQEHTYSVLKYSETILNKQQHNIVYRITNSGANLCNPRSQAEKEPLSRFWLFDSNSFSESLIRRENWTLNLKRACPDEVPPRPGDWKFLCYSVPNWVLQSQKCSMPHENPHRLLCSHHLTTW